MLSGFPRAALSEGACAPNASLQSIWPNRFLELTTGFGILCGFPRAALSEGACAPNASLQSVRPNLFLELTTPPS
jgi:hypothetical protein